MSFLMSSFITYSIAAPSEVVFESHTDTAYREYEIPLNWYSLGFSFTPDSARTITSIDLKVYADVGVSGDTYVIIEDSNTNGAGGTYLPNGTNIGTSDAVNANTFATSASFPYDSAPWVNFPCSTPISVSSGVTYTCYFTDGGISGGNVYMDRSITASYTGNNNFGFTNGTFEWTWFGGSFDFRFYEAA